LNVQVIQVGHRFNRHTLLIFSSSVSNVFPSCAQDATPDVAACTPFSLVRFLRAFLR
jgi:hypothetical protein